jgi:hypothetical protein
MLYRLAADLMLALHFGFIVFVVAGAVGVIRWPKLAWLHVPAAVWGAWIEISGGICPLTTLENRFRTGAGEEGYATSFIEHYLLPVIYPGGLTRTVQLALAAAVIIVNVGLYSYVLRRARKTRINAR